EMSTELGSCGILGKGRDLIDTRSQQQYREGAAFGRTHTLPDSRSDCNPARCPRKKTVSFPKKKPADKHPPASVRDLNLNPAPPAAAARRSGWGPVPTPADIPLWPASCGLQADKRWPNYNVPAHRSGPDARYSWLPVSGPAAPASARNSCGIARSGIHAEFPFDKSPRP